MRSVPRFNRREHERFRLQPMYTEVVVASPANFPTEQCGHAYDISESGVRIELDEALPVGDQVQVELRFPGSDRICSQADVRWVNDALDDPGPRRMALQFTQFESHADEQRLRAYLGSGLQRAAA